MKICASSDLLLGLLSRGEALVSQRSATAATGTEASVIFPRLSTLALPPPPPPRSCCRGSCVNL